MKEVSLTKTKYLFIINPAAGKRDRSTMLAALIKKETEKFDPSEYELHITTGVGDATSFTKDYLEKNKDSFVRVFACGGDGTLNETVNGVFGYENAAVGVIPIGSGNDFIKTFSEYEEKDFLSIKRMIGGDIMTIDALRACERISINIMSVGFDADTTKGMVNFKKLPFVNGSMAYNLSLAKCLFTSRRNRYKYEIDDVYCPELEGDYLFTIMANGKWYGGGFNAAPNAKLDDGEIEVVRIKTVPIYKFLELVGAFRKGDHIALHDLVSTQKCKKIKVISGKQIDLNIDGETMPVIDPVVEIVPSAVKIILPKKETVQK